MVTAGLSDTARRAERQAETHLDGADVYRAVDEIVADFNLRVLGKDVTGDAHMSRRRVSHSRLVMEALGGFGVEDKDAVVCARPAVCGVSASGAVGAGSAAEGAEEAHLVLCVAPLSFTTMVMIASLLVLRRSLCIRTTSSIRTLLTRSPITRTKSVLMMP